jgi:hypothetical protein
MTDVVTPRYRERIAKGEVINNPCSYRRQIRTSDAGTYLGTRAGYPNYTVSNSQTLHHLDLCGLPEWSDADAEWDGNTVANAKLLALRYIDSSPYAFMEDAFELRETVRFLRNPVKGLYNLGREIRNEAKRHKSSRKSLRMLDALSNVWNEYRFAAMPLVRSVSDAMDAYDAKTRTRSVRNSARGKLTETCEKNETKRHTYGSNTYSDFDYTLKGEREVHAGILYEVSNPLDNMRFRLGFRSKDIPETLWAIVPYSFMVDRVANISASIRGMTNLADPSIKILAGYVRTKINVETTCYHKVQNVPLWTVSLTGSPVKNTYGIYEREVWSPSISDTIPPINIGGLVNDIYKVLDLSALAYQAFVPNSVYRKR